MRFPAHAVMVAALAAGVGAQVEPGVVQAGAGFVHTATVAASVGIRHGSPVERGLRVGTRNLPRPLNLIRVIPAEEAR